MSHDATSTYLYVDSTLTAAGVLIDERLASVSERRRLDVTRPSLHPVADSHAELLQVGAAGMVIEMAQGWPGRPQLGLARRALKARRRVVLHWPRERAVEAVDRERLASHWRRWVLAQAYRWVRRTAIALGRRSNMVSLSKALDFPDCVRREFPELFPIAWEAVETVTNAFPQCDLTPLERHSPGLRGFDWSNYLRLSVIRMLHAQQALLAAGVRTGRILDLGSYFGNFALMFAGLGYRTDALDSYQEYGATMKADTLAMRRSGINVLDFKEVGLELAGIPSDSYDAVACMGVIEHVPHTPRPLLQAVYRVLKPDGVLVLDTPNLAYLYNRQKVQRGESIFCPIELQFETEIPFEGHHREYVPREVSWMLDRVGFDVVCLETFNYSLFGLSEISGVDLKNYEAMATQSDCREIILVAARKPPAAVGRSRPDER